MAVRPVLSSMARGALSSLSLLLLIFTFLSMAWSLKCCHFYFHDSQYRDGTAWVRRHVRVFSDTLRFGVEISDERYDPATDNPYNFAALTRQGPYSRWYTAFRAVRRPPSAWAGVSRSWFRLGAFCTQFMVWVPSPLLALLFSIPLALRVRAKVRRAVRRRNGRCLSCGYDLRASAGRCPECGREAPDAPGRAAPTNGPRHARGGAPTKAASDSPLRDADLKVAPVHRVRPDAGRRRAEEQVAVDGVGRLQPEREGPRAAGADDAFAQGSFAQGSTLHT